MSFENIKVIAFDADDTLWKNEDFFREGEAQFCQIMSKYGNHEDVMKELFKVEVENLPLYGFGIKAFALSMMETAIRISNKQVTAIENEKIIAIGKEMLTKKVELIDGVKEVLEQLHGQYRLVVATKGDLLDQERKLDRSGIAHYFHHIEVMSDKKQANYQRLLKHLDIEAHEFLMIGNSLKSDVFPVVELGGQGVHVPYHTTWEYEQLDPASIVSNKFYSLECINELSTLLKK